MLALAVEEQVNLDGPSLNIVLLDDHPEVRMTTVGLLEDMGHKVIQAQSGAVAMDRARSSDVRFYLLLGDYAMPHLGGAELVRLIRQDMPDLPALLITGYADARRNQ